MSRIVMQYDGGKPRGISRVLIMVLIGICASAFALTSYLSGTAPPALRQQQRPALQTAGAGTVLSAADARETEARNEAAEIPPEPVRPVSIMFFGDIMLDRNVELLLDKHGSQYPYEHIQPLIRNADYAVANLEGPVMKARRRTPTGSTRFSFAEQHAEELAEQGFDALSLANNHALDQGAAVLDQTREFLQDRGITPFGHPQKLHTDFVNSELFGERKIVFVGYNAYPDRYGDDAIEFVRKLSQQQAFVVIFTHWGDEYQLSSNARQQTFARALIDGGADLVIGHHPHVVQEVEVYKNRAIFYSLGNFIFDQYFSANTQEGLAVELRITGQDLEYVLYPLASVRSQPQIMQGERAAKFLQSLAARSHEAVRESVAGGILRGLSTAD